MAFSKYERWILGHLNEEFIEKMNEPSSKYLRFEGLLDAKLLTRSTLKNSRLTAENVFCQAVFIPCYGNLISKVSKTFYRVIILSYVLFVLQISLLAAQKFYISSRNLEKHIYTQSNWPVYFSITYFVCFTVILNKLSIPNIKNEDTRINIAKFTKNKMKQIASFSKEDVIPRIFRSKSYTNIGSLTYPYKSDQMNKYMEERRKIMVTKIKSEARANTEKKEINSKNLYADAINPKIIRENSEFDFNDDDISIKEENFDSESSSSQKNQSGKGDQKFTVSITNDKELNESSSKVQKGKFFLLQQRDGNEMISAESDVYFFSPAEMFKILIKIANRRVSSGIYFYLAFLSLFILYILPLVQVFAIIKNSNDMLSVWIYLFEKIHSIIFSFVFTTLLYTTGIELKKSLVSSHLFNCMTSPKYSRKLQLLYLKLNTRSNIKTWLILRSMLRKRSHKQLIDGCISISVIVMFTLTLIIGNQIVNNSENFKSAISGDIFGNETLYPYVRIISWMLVLGVFMVQYSSDMNLIFLSYKEAQVTLLTEQINLSLLKKGSFFEIENTNEIKELLKNVQTLISLVDTPYKITGISPNPLICNFFRIIVVTIFSAITSEIFGLRIALNKLIKI